MFTNISTSRSLFIHYTYPSSCLFFLPTEPSLVPRNCSRHLLTYSHKTRNFPLFLYWQLDFTHFADCRLIMFSQNILSTFQCTSSVHFAQCIRTFFHVFSLHDTNFLGRSIFAGICMKLCMCSKSLEILQYQLTCLVPLCQLQDLRSTEPD